MSDTITIPVRAMMSKQPDGSYKMVHAEYADISADAFARFLMKGFGIDPDKCRVGGQDLHD